MFCTQCGRELKEGVKFCTNCGAAVKSRLDNLEEKETQPSTNEGIPDSAQEEAVAKLEVSKKKYRGLTVVIVLLILLILGTSGAAFWMLGGRDMIMDTLHIDHSNLRQDENAVVDSANQDETETLKEEVNQDEENYVEHVAPSYVDGLSENVTNSLDEAEDESADLDSDMSNLEANMDDEIESEDTTDDADADDEESISSEYILEESDSKYLSKEDLEGLTAEQCRIARNEIYARHGRLFDDEELQNYFESCSWYDGSISPDEFSESMLNEYEIANRDLIIDYENEMGFK